MQRYSSDRRRWIQALLVLGYLLALVLPLEPGQAAAERLARLRPEVPLSLLDDHTVLRATAGQEVSLSLSRAGASPARAVTATGLPAGLSLDARSIRLVGTPREVGVYPIQSVVPSKLQDVVAIAAGGHHSLALRSNGTLAAWGYPQYFMIAAGDWQYHPR